MSGRTVIVPYDVLLDGATGWQAAPDPRVDRVVIDDDGRVRLAPRIIDPRDATPRAALEARLLPQGLALWCDHVFVADPLRHGIWHAGPCDQAPSLLPAIGPRGARPGQLDTPTGLAITGRGDLAVAETEGGRVQLFTLPELALRRIVWDPEHGPPETAPAEGGEPADDEPADDEPADDAPPDDDAPADAPAEDPRWQPIDLAAGPGGTLLVADRRGRIWKLDRQCRRVPHFDGALPEGAVPERLAVDADGYVFVLVEGQDEVLMLRPNGALDSGSETAERPLPEDLPAVVLDGHRLVLPPACGCRRQDLETALAVDDEGRLVVAAADGLPGPFVRRPSAPPRFADTGALRIEPPLDSGRLGNPWHRIALEAEAPERTSIQVYAFASDVERPDVPTPGIADAGTPWEAAPAGADEWLIQSPRGRYLHLAVVLRGPGDRSPALERVYVYARRDSSLRYLPAVYHEDAGSRSVLDRLLSLTDTVRAEVETVIEAFPRVLDARATPPAFLPWLASWFDLAFEPGWSEAVRRRLLAEIVALYRWRGTAAGLERLLAIVTGLDGALPRVVERFRADGHDDLERWFDDGEGSPPPADPARHVVVLLPSTILASAERRLALGRLVAANLPAGTTFTLRPVVPGLRLGGDRSPGSVVGLDTLVGAPNPWRLPGDDDRPAASHLDRLLPPAASCCPDPGCAGGPESASTSDTSTGEA